MIFSFPILVDEPDSSIAKKNFFGCNSSIYDNCDVCRKYDGSNCSCEQGRAIADFCTFAMLGDT